MLSRGGEGAVLQRYRTDGHKEKCGTIDFPIHVSVTKRNRPNVNVYVNEQFYLCANLVT